MQNLDFDVSPNTGPKKVTNAKGTWIVEDDTTSPHIKIDGWGRRFSQGKQRWYYIDQSNGDFMAWCDEYLINKFKQVNTRLSDLEKRCTALESYLPRGVLKNVTNTTTNPPEVMDLH